MHVHSDFDLSVVLHDDGSGWVPSPLPGVERRMLDRVGGEVARATSLVRYAPGAGYEAHSHGAGEEILVLEGVFSDESGDHPVGTYLRNTPGSRHTRHSRVGCLLFVKLRQFAGDDLSNVRIDTPPGALAAGPGAGARRHASACPRRGRHRSGPLGARHPLRAPRPSGR